MIIQTSRPYFSLRPARETESAQIKALNHLVGINPMDLDWKRFVVAVNDRDEMIGCGQLKPHGKDILELASLAVYILCANPPLGLFTRNSVFEKFRTKRCRVIFSGSANLSGWQPHSRTGKNACL